jgi:hypothetical protein
MLITKSIIALLLIALGVWLSWNAIQGIFSGKVRHSDSSSIAVKTKEPMKFWLIIIVQLLLAVLFFVGSLTTQKIL